MKSFYTFINEEKKSIDEKGYYLNKNGIAVPIKDIHFKMGHKGFKEETSPLSSLPGGHMSASEVNAHSKKLRDYQGTHKEADWRKTRGHVRYYEQDSDALDKHGGEGSTEINDTLRHNHRHGSEPTKHMDKFQASVHHTIMSKSKPLGHETHLHSGIGFDAGKAAGESKDKILHLPAHISTTHDIKTASNYAHGHMMHIHAKASDKGFHIPNSPEHETIIPAGTKLKHTHTTTHEGEHGQTHQVHHFTIHHQD